MFYSPELIRHLLGELIVNELPFRIRNVFEEPFENYFWKKPNRIELLRPPIYNDMMSYFRIYLFSFLKEYGKTKFNKTSRVRSLKVVWIKYCEFD